MKIEKLKLHLLFEDAAGRRGSIVVPDPKDDITAEEAAKVGNLIVEKGAVDSTSGSVYKVYKGAKIVRTITEPLN